VLLKTFARKVSTRARTYELAPNNQGHFLEIVPAPRAAPLSGPAVANPGFAAGVGSVDPNPGALGRFVPLDGENGPFRGAFADHEIFSYFDRYRLEGFTYLNRILDLLSNLFMDSDDFLTDPSSQDLRQAVLPHWREFYRLKNAFLRIRDNYGVQNN
jgi:hypothetical protein